MIKVLYIINNAPNYREDFLRELSKKVDLTVLAEACDNVTLTPPNERIGYKYIEVVSKKRMGLFWQPEVKTIVKSDEWDVILCSYVSRHLIRLWIFLSNPSLWKRWVWVGLMYGKNESKFLDWLRNVFLKRSASVLVNSEIVVKKLKKQFNIDSISFNNTEVKRSDFRKGQFDSNHNTLRLLFVGANKPRKQLQRLLDIAKRRKDVEIRIVGPNMESLSSMITEDIGDSVTIFGKTTGDLLNQHFDWADISVSPGNVGLLVANSARHGKGIVIDNNSYHGPEHYLAVEAEQPFISFANDAEVDAFIDKMLAEKSLRENLGAKIQSVAIDRYTIEYMADKFELVINQTYSKLVKRR